ncbi:MAG: hypothetical protein AB7O66_09520 [Limisphaerales bacterium]
MKSRHHPPLGRKRLGPFQMLLLSMGALFLGGCASPEQSSDWRWKQFNPDYRPPLPPTEYRSS